MKNPPPSCTDAANQIVGCQLDNCLKSSKRIEYIDALRGLTMFLVVVGHVWTFVVLKEKTATALFFTTFRMPVFFFISGFVGYKASASFASKDLGVSVWKKISMALVPCFIFYTIYSLTFGPDRIVGVEHGIFDPDFYNLFLSGNQLRAAFGGYWFIPELFTYFLFYYLILYVCSRCNKTKYATIGLFSVAIAYFLLYAFIGFGHLFITGNIVYMALGLMARQFFPYFDRLLCNEWLNAVAIILWAVLYALNKNHGFEGSYGAVVRTIAIFVVFSFFYHCRHFFAAGGRLSKIMQYVGRHTLDIYLLHYFFLPVLPASILALVASDERSTIPLLAAGLIIAAMVVAVCLLISGVVRTNSNVLAHYLFGAKRVKS